VGGDRAALTALRPAVRQRRHPPGRPLVSIVTLTTVMWLVKTHQLPVLR